MKYVYVCAAICIFLFGTHLYAFKTGYASGRDKIKSELYEYTQVQTQAVVKASQKILDFQAIIGNNYDECFNRVWPDDIISTVNPELR